MKLFIKLIYGNMALMSLVFFLIGCSNNSTEESKNDSAANHTAAEQTEDANSPTDKKSDNTATDDLSDEAGNNRSSADSADNESDSNPSEDSETVHSYNSAAEESEDNHTLSSYSSEEIEYARVWLQLGPNQDIDELYVEHLPSGTRLDPNDEDNDVSYPEDVIQISGSRIADGMITYSGNGDGTINVYEIPYGNRWYGGMPRPDEIDLDQVEKEMRDIIENTESVYINPGDNDEIITIIEKIRVVE
ncbi:hypothetical protein [Oceanobacillus sp. J11TS1]|uniref:hypothetical protein n=1 Tax=Oceanobacillus sp. J11TS1 TaxID=2807191 RepID=UPI001B04F2FE|nr:hypothetical protein [Oceanobacillus sp. J11TS1]GIO21443.1 putative lipoprotein YdeJ [Oceanobacillus sp. J11TS1]